MSSGRESIRPPLSQDVVSAYPSRSLTSNGTSLVKETCEKWSEGVAKGIQRQFDTVGEPGTQQREQQSVRSAL
jgi:hypothetical protein